VPCLVVSGDASIAGDVRQAGGAFLPKPFTPSQVLDALRGMGVL